VKRKRFKDQGLLLDDEDLQAPGPGYQPLPSIWYGTDADLLELLLQFYPRKPPRLILDATVNVGRFWKGSQRPVIGLEANAQFHPWSWTSRSIRNNPAGFNSTSCAHPGARNALRSPSTTTTGNSASGITRRVSFVSMVRARALCPTFGQGPRSEPFWSEAPSP
jgi:hypothetical protein